MSNFTYIAADGNYGDASGLKLVPADQLPEEIESDTDAAYYAERRGTNTVWLVTVDSEGTNDKGLHATFDDAVASVVDNYLDGQSNEDTDVFYELHLQALTLSIVELVIPQLS